MLEKNVIDDLIETMKIVDFAKFKNTKKFEYERKRIRGVVRRLVKEAKWSPGVAFDKNVYKAIKAEYSQNNDLSRNTPLTTIGSIKHSGRFHRKKISHTCHNPALYLGSAFETVGAEAKIDSLTAPTTIWPIHAKLQCCLDLLTKTKALENLIFFEGLLNLEWKHFNDIGKIPSYSQLIGLEAFKRKYEAILIPSARTPIGFNIVVFPENLRLGSYVSLSGDSQELEDKNKILKKNQRIDGKK